MTMHQMQDQIEGRIGLLGEEPIDFSDLASVLVEDYQVVSPAEGLSPEDLEYRNTESWAALRGLLQCLSTRLLVVNHLVEKEHFDSRLGELSLLDSYGLPVPRVLVTSEPEEARRFYQDVGSVLYRPVNGAHMPFQKLQSEDLGRLEELRLSPVHFEEEPQGRLAALVKVGKGSYRNPRELELPEELVENFEELCEELGLHVAELRLCQSGPDAPWLALGISPFFTEAGLQDPEATDAVLRMLEFGEVDV